MRGAATTAMKSIAETRQRSRRPRAAANPQGAWGLRPHASLLVVIDATTSIPPRASPGTRKPQARGPCQYSGRLLAGATAAWGERAAAGGGAQEIAVHARDGLDGDPLRAGGLALGVVGAAAE